jgi:D,D-heptose 1,7-bisphosphate phosphatase
MSPEDKICLLDALQQRQRQLPRPLVMTNGVFDVLHRGHVDYLHRAAQLGESLLVAVNTDASTQRLGKGPDRPLNKELDRAFVLAGLSAVSMVTFIDTCTPVELIEVVRPDIYVKGGDYDMETLEETRVVRSWVGHSVVIPFVNGFSTTELVQRIRQPATPALRNAAFLDRDGVINKDKAYVSTWEYFEYMPGAVEGIRRLQQAGYALAVVTNQSGLARGYYTEYQYQTLTARLRQELAAQGVTLDGVYHCPHHPQGSVALLAIDCNCRKPKPGLILQAVQELKLSLSGSLLVGDKPGDIEAAHASGVGRAYMVDSDNPESGAEPAGADGRFTSLLKCTENLFPAITPENRT